MILVDTSVWIDHLRAKDRQLTELLMTANVLIHPFIIGELACGNLKNRQEILQLLGSLPKVKPATNQEVLYLIEKNKIMGKGIGYVDAHLLASVAISEGAKLWTRDKRLSVVASDLGIGFDI